MALHTETTLTSNVLWNLACRVSDKEMDEGVRAQPTPFGAEDANTPGETHSRPQKHAAQRHLHGDTTKSQFG